MKIDSGDIKFDALTVTSSITIDDYTAGDTSSKYLDLDANGVGYKYFVYKGYFDKKWRNFFSAFFDLKVDFGMTIGSIVSNM